MHAVDQMRARIGQTLALFADVEIPGRPPIRNARHGLQQLMRIAEADARFGGISRHRFPENFGVVAQRLDRATDFAHPAGHQIMHDETPFLGQGQHRFQSGQILAPDDRRLVGQHMQPGRDRRLDPLDLHSVTAGNDRDAAGRFLGQPCQKIRRGLDLQLPPGRRLALRVQAGNPAEVVDQLGPERRIDICFRRQARIHLLLYQRGMEMAGID